MYKDKNRKSCVQYSNRKGERKFTGSLTQVSSNQYNASRLQLFENSIVFAIFVLSVSKLNVRMQICTTDAVAKLVHINY